jgi:hypothetical protein
MRLFYLTKQDTHDAGARFFDDSHYVVLSSGEILVSAKFSTPQAEKIWASQPHVLALPHPLSGQQVGAAIAARLSDLEVAATDTVFQVSEKAKKIHPQLSLHVL